MEIGPGYRSSSRYKSPSSARYGYSSSPQVVYRDRIVQKEVSLPNPDPNRYEIVRFLERGSLLIIEIRYLDCTNYEGRKILLYECSLVDLVNQKQIDPHFCEDSKWISPIARFEPTDRGWNLAYKLAYEIAAEE